jgi:hypothetical protein
LQLAAPKSYALGMPFTAIATSKECKLWRKQMKSIVPSLILILGIIWLLPACASKETSDEARLNKVDAVQAMAIANEWNWSNREITSYVTPREVVFKFPDKKVKKIPLPEDKMLVAVAPYINSTHT